MNSLSTVLTKTLVREFYRQYAGLFVIVLLFAGGFLRGQEHKALASYAVHDPFVLSLYFLVWLAYTLLAINFGLQTFRQHSFLQFLRLVPPLRRYTVLILASLQLLTPVLAYAGFVAGVAWEEKVSQGLLWLTVGVLVLVLLPVLLFDFILRTPSFRLAWRPVPRGRFRTVYPFFFIRYLVSKEPLSLFLTKAGSLLLLAGLCTLYPTDSYDLRLLLLGALLAAALHSGLVYSLYRFEAVYLLMLRNLPLSLPRRLLLHLLMLTLLLVPELILLLRNRPVGVSLPQISWVWGLLTALVSGVYAVLFVKHRPPDRLMPVVFGMVILYFFLIMYRIPALLLVPTTLAVSVLLFVRYYPHAEPAFSQ